MFSEDAKKSREYTSITINSNDTTNTTDTTENPDEAESIPKTASDTVAEDMKEIFPDESIPTISFGTDFSTSSSSEAPVFNATDDSSSESEEVIAYENEGLSDVSEDPDVLEEQDKLDF